MCTHKNDRPLQKHIGIVGVGSGGSALADMLWRKGADKIYGEFTLTLVDPERFENSNISRHILGPESFGKFKAEEMAKRYPGARFYNTKFGERRFLPSVRWNTPEGCVRWGHPKPTAISPNLQILSPVVQIRIPAAS